jgi:predicted metal-dependent HD superfamily phosphohydrolase
VFKEFAQDCDSLDTETCAQVEQIIFDTKTHTVGSQNSVNELFLDADLSILGMPTDVYVEYAQRIRKEYMQYSLEDYCTGRAKVLRSLVGKENIFFTQLFRDKFEAQARSNT